MPEDEAHGAAFRASVCLFGRPDDVPRSVRGDVGCNIRRGLPKGDRRVLATDELMAELGKGDLLRQRLAVEPEVGITLVCDADYC